MLGDFENSGFSGYYLGNFAIIVPLLESVWWFVKMSNSLISIKLKLLRNNDGQYILYVYKRAPTL